MAIKVAALAVEIIRGGQPDRVKRDLKDVDRAGAKAGKSVLGLNNVLKAVGIGFSVVAIMRGLRSAARAFLDFDAAMVESLAIMGDVSAGMRDTMGRAAKDVAKITTFSASEAAESYFFLASAGLDAQQSIAALPQVAKFAQAGMFDMARATDLATDAQSALGLTVDNASQNLTNLTRVTDVLVMANTLANASVSQFSESLTNKAGAALKIVGKDIEEGVAVLAAFADQGLKGAEAGTALNIVFRDMQTKALRNKRAFEEMGVTVFDAAGEMRNIADVIGDLEGALAGMSDEQKKAALMQLGFADKSVIFIQTILGQSEAIRGYEQELRKAGGTTEEVADKQLESLKSQLELTKNAFQNLTITLVEFIAESPFLNEVLTHVRDLFKDMTTILESNAENIKSMFAEVGRLAANAFLSGFWGAIGLGGDAIFQNWADKAFEGMETAMENIAALAKDVSADMALAAFYADRFAKSEIKGWIDVPGMPGAKLPIYGAKGDETETGGPGTSEPSGTGTGAAGPKKIGFDPTDPFGLRRKPTVGMKAPAAAGGAEPLIFGGFEMDLSGVLSQLEEFMGALEQITAETMQMISEMADTIELGLEQTLGDAIFNGLEAAFDTGNLKSFFEHFGKTLLAGFGDILVQLGQILIQYGITMEALRPFLTNIFTAGPAAIAAGVALIALGSAFTSITSSGSGGVGRGSATSGAFREPRYGFSQLNDDVARRTINMGTAPNVQAQPATINNFTIIGPDDPTVQRQMGELIQNAARRGIRFT